MFNRVKFKGIVEYKLRDNKTGEVVREGREENLFTNSGKRMNYFQMQSNPGQTVLWIGNDGRAIGEKGNTIVRADPVTNINDTEQSVGFASTGWNRSTLTRVVSVAFPAPTGGNRTTTHVGWKLAGAGGVPVEGRHEMPYTALEISPPIVQTTLQTLEVTYTIVIVLPKSITGLKRFKGIGDAAALRRLQYRYIDTGPNQGTIALSPCTFPRYWFVDEGNYVQGFSQGGSNQTWYQADWHQVQLPTQAYPGLATKTGTISETVAEGNGNAPGSRNGAFGSCSVYDNVLGATQPNTLLSESQLMQYEGWSFWPFVFDEGFVGPDVFPQPSRSGQAVGSNHYLFNQTGVDKSGQGTLDIQGPYIPTIDPGAPTHWVYRLMNAKSGSVVGAGTEGGYIFARKSWLSYPWGPQPDIGEVPPDPNIGNVNLMKPDTTWGASAMYLLAMTIEVHDSLYGTDNPRPAHRMVYDGIDTFWGLMWRDGDAGGGGHTLFRWRGLTPENTFKGVNNPFLSALSETGDDAQSDFRFVDQSGNEIGLSPSLPYAFTTDGAGQIFYGHRTASDNTAANNPIFTIDNTQPGRWKQRPSGSADGVDADRFTVDSNDEVHAMFPFVGGDVTKRLRIVDGANAGIYVVATFVDANNVDLFESDGITPATLVADAEMTWHWCTVTKRTNHSVGELFHLLYDQNNSRLWAVGALGLQVSTDDGTTWSSLVDESGGSIPQFPDAGPRTNIQVGAAGISTNTPCCVDANGDFYWASNSSEYWLNKLSYGTTGPGGDATFSRLGLTTNFPAGNKPLGFNQLVFDIGCDNSNGLGAIWIHGDAGLVGAPYTQSFYRLTVNAGALAAVDLTKFDPTAFTVMTQHPGWIMTTPGGMSVMANASNYARPQFFFVPRALGGGLDAAFFQMTTGGGQIFYSSTFGVSPPAFRNDGTFLVTSDNTGQYGCFGSFWNNYFWDENNSVWVPWEGTPAQFDAFYGTTNGGWKVPHTGFEELLDNVQVKFTPAGGGTADTDEFKEGESFCFAATFGPHRTNVEDFSITPYHSEMAGIYELESEAIKTAVPNTRPVRVFWNQTVSDPVVGTFQDVSVATPITDLNGKLWGWEPQRVDRLNGVGDSPDVETSTSVGDFQATLDLGAAPPEIGKIRIMVGTDENNGSNERDYIHFNSAQTNTIWFGASDDGTFTDLVFGGASNEYNAPNARWINASEQFPDGFNIEECANYQISNAAGAFFTGWLIEIDLVTLGMTAGERTHRYWQMVYNRLSNGRPMNIYWMEALDPSGNRIGMTSNMRVDEADTDPEFAGVLIDEAHWIQDKPGKAPNNPTTISSSGATATGYTNTVVVDAGTFNTALIDATTDYLAWEEPNNVGPGYLRDVGNRDYDLVRGKSGVVNDVSDGTSKQAMSKITSVAAGTITVRDAIIPDSLANANWEVRRPMYDGTDYSGRPSVGLLSTPQATNLNGMGYCPYEGYFNHNEDNETNQREFRVTRKTVFKIS